MKTILSCFAILSFFTVFACSGATTSTENPDVVDSGVDSGSGSGSGSHHDSGLLKMRYDAAQTESGVIITPDAHYVSEAGTGGNCNVKTASGITLCETIDLCPGLIVDQKSFPGCGFEKPV